MDAIAVRRQAAIDDFLLRKTATAMHERQGAWAVRLRDFINGPAGQGGYLEGVTRLRQRVEAYIDDHPRSGRIEGLRKFTLQLAVRETRLRAARDLPLAGQVQLARTLAGSRIIVAATR